MVIHSSSARYEVNRGREWRTNIISTISTGAGFHFSYYPFPPWVFRSFPTSCVTHISRLSSVSRTMWPTWIGGSRNTSLIHLRTAQWFHAESLLQNWDQLATIDCWSFDFPNIVPRPYFWDDCKSYNIRSVPKRNSFIPQLFRLADECTSARGPSLHYLSKWRSIAGDTTNLKYLTCISSKTSMHNWGTADG